MSRQTETSALRPIRPRRGRQVQRSVPRQAPARSPGRRPRRPERRARRPKRTRSGRMHADVIPAAVSSSSNPTQGYSERTPAPKTFRAGPSTAAQETLRRRGRGRYRRSGRSNPFSSRSPRSVVSVASVEGARVAPTATPRRRPLLRRCGAARCDVPPNVPFVDQRRRTRMNAHPKLAARRRSVNAALPPPPRPRPLARTKTLKRASPCVSTS